MEYANPESLVSTDWLEQHLTAPDVRIVDATWYMAGSGRDAKAEYEACHIPGAVRFDIDDIADDGGSLPHQLPPPEKFSSRMRKLGIGDGNRIVCYDGGGASCAAERAWWMFKVFGHRDVSVLDGGMGKWLQEGRRTQDLPPMPRQRHFTARVDTFLVRDFDGVRKAMEDPKVQIIDARAPDRFAGQAEEPRPTARKGHIPGSVNLPYGQLFDEQTRTYKPAPDLKAAFEAAGVDLSRPVVTSCGSGVTACTLAFGLHLLGHRDWTVYDGSWADWGNREDAPVETG